MPPKKQTKSKSPEKKAQIDQPRTTRSGSVKNQEPVQPASKTKRQAQEPAVIKKI